MKVAINNKYGGFSLSALAVQELAKLNNKPCYFFDYEKNPITLEEAETTFMFFAYSVPNPQDYKLNERDEDGLFKSANERAELISLNTHPKNRHDPKLIQVIEQLGEKANAKFSKLKIVEIPDETDYVIEEYDGLEHIAEVHKTWS